MITARYRKDYIGEHVVVNTGYLAGIKQQKREWVENTIINQHSTGRAVVIGSAIDRPLFDYRLLARHRGGLLNRKSMQSYATGTLWREMSPHFFVTTDSHQADLMVQTDFPDQTTVITIPKFCLKYPGRFHIVPYSPVITDMAKCVYLAAFDGHREIFLIGYTKETPGMDNRCIKDVNSVLSAYTNTTFTMVGVPTSVPDLWLTNPNVKRKKYREFRDYCDV